MNTIYVESTIIDEFGNSIKVSPDLTSRSGAIYLETVSCESRFVLNARQAQELIDAIRKTAAATGVALQ